MEKEKKDKKEKKEDKAFPMYISNMEGRTCVRHCGNGVYYRDAGLWEMHVKWKDGKLICSDRGYPYECLSGKEFKECSRKEWLKDNEGYV